MRLTLNINTSSKEVQKYQIVNKMKDLLSTNQTRLRLYKATGHGAETFSMLSRQALWKKWPQNARKHCQANSLKYSQILCRWKGQTLYVNSYWIKLKFLYIFMSMYAIIWRLRDWAIRNVCQRISRENLKPQGAIDAFFDLIVINKIWFFKRTGKKDITIYD